ncbi:hypothetical protein [Brevundimonas sp.]
MPETDDRQRFDRLLDAMVKKPPLDVKPKDEPTEEDLREDDEG